MTFVWTLATDSGLFAGEIAYYEESAGYRRKVHRRLGITAVKPEDPEAFCQRIIEGEWELMCAGAQFSPQRIRYAMIYVLVHRAAT